MKPRQGDVLNTAHHVQGFRDENGAVLGPNLTNARRSFDAAVDQLTAMAVSQSGGIIASRGATARQQALRSNLRNGQMKAIAQVAKLSLADVPEIHQLTLPTKANTTSATSGIRAQEQRVRTLVKMLNALIVPKLGTDATLLSMWRSGRAIDHESPMMSVPASIGSPDASAPAPQGVTRAAARDDIRPRHHGQPHPQPPFSCFPPSEAACAAPRLYSSSWPAPVRAVGRQAARRPRSQ